MNRFHVHVSIEDIDASIRFYAAVFGAAPTVVKPNYAKWMVDDPPINFAISKHGSVTGIDHLGIQVDSDEQLTALRTTDPQSVAWETFYTVDTIPVYGDRLCAHNRLLQYRADRRNHD